ncbi:hypothetical protein BN2537_12915 [Streptomyces venezuelae]|nr:hypothetical protein BN2537_12915 [Streptomyces venezuelae]
MREGRLGHGGGPPKNTERQAADSLGGQRGSLRRATDRRRALGARVAR